MRSLFLCLGVVLAVGCTGDRPADPSGPLGIAPPPSQAAPVEPKVMFASAESLLEKGQPSSNFNFGTLRDLWTRVQLPGMSQVTTIKLKFYTPRGWLFRTTFAVFSPDPATKTVDAPGADHPIDVSTAKSIPGGYALDFAIPIGGTPFTKFPEVGTWQVRAEVSGLTEDLSSPMTVEMHR